MLFICVLPDRHAGDKNIDSRYLDAHGCVHRGLNGGLDAFCHLGDHMASGHQNMNIDGADADLTQADGNAFYHRLGHNGQR